MYHRYIVVDFADLVKEVTTCPPKGFKSWSYKVVAVFECVFEASVQFFETDEGVYKIPTGEQLCQD